jgi:pimeloyl-ACP methyl ester carboxylesterase
MIASNVAGMIARDGHDAWRVAIVSMLASSAVRQQLDGMMLHVDIAKRRPENQRSSSGDPMPIVNAAPRSETVQFVSRDGFTCNLIHVTGDRPAPRGPVLLVHGAGVRANIFRAPVETTIVDALLEHGYDVWLENWRASIDLPANRWTLDQAALYDHPAAVDAVVQQTGADSVKAIIHCQGSTSFMMSAIAGLVPKVDVVVTNAVSLHPVIPAPSRTKLKYAVPLVRRMTDYLDPQWGLEQPTAIAKMVNTFVQATHHECNNPVCKQVSFTYGTGFPALWRHENLNDATHDWLSHEFARVPLTFFEQITRCVDRGNLLAVEGHRELPADFAAVTPQTDARFAFFAGEKNLCFLPESQVRSYEHFNRLRPNYHSLRLIPDYGHLDIFMGQRAARDVFPLMLAELDGAR